MSRAMVARLRAKPGGEDIDVTIGDFATTTVDGTFSVAYLVFNTIENLTTQAAQVACFRNAADHLEPGGCFVVEVGPRQLGLRRLISAPDVVAHTRRRDVALVGDAAADRLRVAGVMVGAEHAELGVAGRHAPLELLQAPLVDGAERLDRAHGNSLPSLCRARGRARNRGG